MKRQLNKVMALAGAAILTFSLAGCSSSANETTAADTTAEAGSEEASEEAAPADLSGSITMAGSTSMEKLANALSEVFMEKYPNVSMQAEFTGSSAGIEALLAGQADIGNVSRELKAEELEKGVVSNVVAIDGIAVIKDNANAVADLTKQQLTDIYTGTITNWSELGGENQPIVVIGREAGSGTRGAFEEILGVEDACAYSNELDSTGAVVAKVASTPGAIGYVSLDVLDDTVTPFSLEGVEPTAENIKAGDYFLSRPFVMATLGEISEQNELVQATFDLIYSEEGSALVEAVGLITVD